jgi:hypothetical protein
MLTPIWVIVNAGGRFREKNLPDRIDAKVSKDLTEQRLDDQADILAPGPYKQARKLKCGDRLAHLQGGRLSMETYIWLGRVYGCRCCCQRGYGFDKSSYQRLS